MVQEIYNLYQQVLVLHLDYDNIKNMDMKNIKNVFIAAWMSVTFLACSGGDVTPENPEPTPKPTESITIPSSENLSPSFDAEGGSCTISFNATDAWTASVTNNRADAWCTVEPTSGIKGNNTITIRVKENEEADDRNAVIQLKASTTTKNINVTQKQKNALTLTTNKYQIPSKGGEFEIEIKANVKYSYTIDDKAKEWISYESSRALSTSYLKFKVAMNQGDKREGVITITDGTLTEKVTVYQEASGPTIVLSKNEFTVASEGETITVEVSSNVDVEVQMPEVDWIKENKSRAFSTHTYHYVIAPNEGYDNREAEIVFKNKENNLKEKVVVRQLQEDAIVLAENEYTLSSDGGHLDFNVSSNVEFKVTVEGEWIKQVESRGLIDKPLYFDIAENTSEDEREGKIILTGEKIQQEIKVIQKGKTSFDISTRAVEVDGNGGTFELTITSNIGYKIESNVDWVKEVESRASNNYVHKFEVLENPTVEPRSGVIIVCNDEEVCIPVTVTQKGGTPVETGWENKDFYHRSLVMRFTADWCGYCPTMASNIVKAQEMYPDKIEAVHVHGNSSSLIFSGYSALDKLYGIDAYPTGIMDMRRDIYSTSSIKTALDETEENYPTQTGIGFYSNVDGNQLNLNLHVYAKKPDEYKVTVLLLEDNIVGTQNVSGVGTVRDYVHNGIARVAVSDVLGDDCTTTSDNQVIRKNYSVSIPASYKKENMRIVVYVQRPFGQQKVLADSNYNGYYVDNCASGKLGTNLRLATIENASGNENEDIIPGDEIEF